MSEPLPEDWDQFIDWSKHDYDWSRSDLLDACHDPMLQGNGLHSIDFHSYHFSPLDNHDPDTFSMGPPHPSNQESQGNNLEHEAVACASCGEVFTHSSFEIAPYSLDFHSRISGHLSFTCGTVGCHQRFPNLRERNAHQKRPHVTGHGRMATPTPYDCVECGHSSSSKADLLRHAKESQHQPYACECGSMFSRLDVLHRHLEKFDPKDPEHPCKYCKRHRGPNGFRRLDHLMQHIRNYHNHEMDNDPNDGPDDSRYRYTYPTCRHPECPEFRDATFKQQPRKVQHAGKPFASQAAFTKHMRDTHNECAYPCDVTGCDRVGKRGYFREKDLLKHRRTQHPEAAPYQVTKRELRVQCPVGCGAVLYPSSFQDHTCTQKYYTVKVPWSTFTMSMAT